jgi:D-3-phosphoglycerate dehydrogenase / 2-oxoglutarate reductase
MARILVTEEIADTGLDKLRAAGHEVDVRLGLSPEELLDVLPGAQALIIRSATQVDATVLDAGRDLQVVGRAGIGLDNVDVAHATRNGVMVVNAPQSNILSAAEHTMALLLAQARNIPQAHAALVDGRWERSRWTGVELADKTLGIIGLGRIGKLVAQRALAFGMRLVGYDPFVSPDRARQLSVELVGLDELAARSDFITVHVAKTPDTVGLIGAEFLARAKPGVRIVNVARGGIVDEAALRDAIVAGRVGGAALDVFATEPCTDSPLFGLPEVVVTPHLGASTHEAQDKAGVTIAEQLGLALAGDFVPFAVNVDASAVAETVRPFLPLAEKLGGLFAALTHQLPPVVEVVFEGDIGGYDNKLAVLSAVKGILAQISDEPVSYVNALALLDDRGIEVRTVASSTAHDYVNRVSIRGGGRSLAATLIGLRDEARLVQVDGHTIDVPPSPNMLIVRNDDRPGMIGVVGTLLGDAGVNIDDMDVGRDAHRSSAVMVIATGGPTQVETVEKLRSTEGILSVDAVNLR